MNAPAMEGGVDPVPELVRFGVGERPLEIAQYHTDEHVLLAWGHPASSSPSTATDRSSVMAGMDDTGRYGSRSSICSAIRGSADRRRRMSGIPLRSIRN